jgi:DNA-binding CsgD family transcriptional regulator
VETRYTARFTDNPEIFENSADEREMKLDRATAMLEGGPGDARRPAQALYLLGVIAWIIGDLDTARMYTEEGLIKARNSADRIMSAYLLNVAGQIALEQGEDVNARTLLEAGLSLHREVGDTLGCLNALFFLERIHASRGERTQARAYAEEHLVRSKAIGFTTGIVGTLTFLGCLALEENDATAAGALFDESLALLREMRDNLPLAVATNLQGIGVTLAKVGRLTEAVQLWGAAAAMSALLPEERTFVSRESAVARAQLGEQVFTGAWTAGQVMSLEQALVEVENIVCRGQSHPSSSGNSQVQTQHSPSPGQQLTVREEEVLRLVARGLTDAQVAEALIISPRTVNAHLRSIYAKLNISSRNAATHFALEHHMI